VQPKISLKRKGKLLAKTLKKKPTMASPQSREGSSSLKKILISRDTSS
jgi:hypothetical protein